MRIPDDFAFPSDWEYSIEGHPQLQTLDHLPGCTICPMVETVSSGGFTILVRECQQRED